jgi:hypothetical protein
MKIKALVLSCFLFFIIENIFSQEVKPKMHTIDSIPEYKIINPDMRKAIHSVLSYTKDCAYYSVLNKPYLIWISINTSWLSVESIPYSSTNINLYRSVPGIVEEGFCNYKGHIVFIRSSVPNYINRFFKSTGKKRNLYYHNSENLVDHMYRAYRGVTLFFDYKNGKIVCDCEDEPTPCIDQYFFYYVVQAEDTWQDIANKSGCSIENLTAGWKDAEKPIEGSLIIVHYYFDEEDSKWIKISRDQ